MTTNFCKSLEEALKKAKLAGKRPGCEYRGITLPTGEICFVVYKNGVMVERYIFILQDKKAFHSLWSNPPKLSSRPET